MIVPSVVTTIPIVACSRITFWVPVTAALVNGISSWYHGVFTMRSCPASSYPEAPFTKYPTQSIRRTFTSTSRFRCITAASFGTNFGSVVIIVLPAADCGSSSLVCSFICSSSILGNTITSIKRLINVDFPVLTGPTTPI